MKVNFSPIAFGILFMASACNNSSESTTNENDTAVAQTAVDTAVAVNPPVPVIDSAAITREFLAAQEKGKKATPTKPKTQGKNKVVVYNEASIPSHEALAQQSAQTQATPATERVVHTKEYVYFIPSQPASFPGGQAALAAHVAKKVVYPEQALEYRIEGTVYAEVTIDSLGYVKNIEYPAKNLGYGLEEETTEVLMNTPRWVPAKENGKRVTSKLTVPVVYKIAD